MNVLSAPVLCVHHTVASLDTNIGVYPTSETAVSRPWPWHVNHALHGMNVTIFMLPHTICVRDYHVKNYQFRVYQALETAARAPWPWHVNHALQDMHLRIFMLPRAIYFRDSHGTKCQYWGIPSLRIGRKRTVSVVCKPCSTWNVWNDGHVTTCHISSSYSHVTQY